MLTHQQKVKLSRKPGMQTRADRKRIKLGQATHGMMVSRFFGSSKWLQRKDSIKNKGNKLIVLEPKKEEEQPIDKGYTQE